MLGKKVKVENEDHFPWKWRILHLTNKDVNGRNVVKQVAAQSLPMLQMPILPLSVRSWPNEWQITQINWNAYTASHGNRSRVPNFKEGIVKIQENVTTGWPNFCTPYLREKRSLLSAQRVQKPLKKCVSSRVFYGSDTITESKL